MIVRSTQIRCDPNPEGALPPGAIEAAERNRADEDRDNQSTDAPNEDCTGQLGEAGQLHARYPVNLEEHESSGDDQDEGPRHT